MLDDNNGLCDFSTANHQQPYFISSTQEQQQSERAHQTLQKCQVWYPPVNKIQPFKNLTINSTMKMHGLVETLLHIYISLVKH